MSFKDEFVGVINEGFGARADNQGGRPTMEVWPENDDFERWVAWHENPTRAVICATLEFKNTPFCGSGLH